MEAAHEAANSLSMLINLTGALVWTQLHPFWPRNQAAYSNATAGARGEVYLADLNGLPAKTGETRFDIPDTLRQKRSKTKRFL